MVGNTDIIQDFTTPDRKPPHSSMDQEEKKEASSKEAEPDLVNKPATVTPQDSTGNRENREKVISGVDSPEDRHVRFDKEMNKADITQESPGDSSSASSKRGFVSRRGGRLTSPGRVANSNKQNVKDSTVLEFKAFRSPQRKRDDSDNVPSLCSSNGEKRGAVSSSVVKAEDVETSADKKPSSISCDSAINQTSPLAPVEGEQSQEAKKAKSKGEKGEAGARKNNVTFSPVPPSKENVVVRTPTRSPTRGQFQSLPNLDDAAFRSPGNFFLSPHPPTPSYRSLQETGSFDTSEKKVKGEDRDDLGMDSKPPPLRSPKTPKSPRTPRREDRDRFVATPTDFATDYGKHPNSGSFDNSNVLAWLQSPTANGLFSPGGFGSMLNTPRGGAPRTPRTPTVSTSFFFSDVASLPRSGDYGISPKPDEGKGKRGGKAGYSNIICISPLASSKAKNGAGLSHTPTINYKEMFLSPAERTRGLSLLGESPMKGLRARGGNRQASRDPSLDAVHMAERDLMEDEDLSVLLQLASNTPRSTSGERPVTVSTSEGTHVFRQPNGRGGSHPGDENLPSLQLPIIGGRDSLANGARLSRKTHSRDHGETTDGGFRRPLDMHSKDSAGAKPPYPGESKKAGSKDEKDMNKRHDGPSGDSSKKGSKPGGHHPQHPPYPLPHPHPYDHHAAPPYPYPPMPPGMPHGGSMRVVVGGPPPPRGAKNGSPSRPHPPRPPYSMGPNDPNYPPPPYPPPPGHYHHHPGVPPPHMHPHYGHYPPPHHRPPSGHMPMYGAQHPPGKGKPPTKKLAKPLKAGTKRPSPTSVPKSGAKKAKKSSPPKKKNKSPQLTDKAERQKAAATIQAVNAASGGKNDKAAALAAAILRGVTMRPSGKWQAQLYFAGKSRYIGVFDTREKAALAYEIAREKLKSEKNSAEGGQLTPKATEAAVTLARKAAFEGVNERDPRLAAK